jgi:hypothetical protein
MCTELGYKVGQTYPKEFCSYTCTTLALECGNYSYKVFNVLTVGAPHYLRFRHSKGSFPLYPEDFDSRNLMLKFGMGMRNRANLTAAIEIGTRILQIEG